MTSIITDKNFLIKGIWYQKEGNKKKKKNTNKERAQLAYGYVF
jgi:hypothetical protein